MRFSYMLHFILYTTLTYLLKNEMVLSLLTQDPSPGPSDWAPSVYGNFPCEARFSKINYNSYTNKQTSDSPFQNRFLSNIFRHSQATMMLTVWRKTTLEILLSQDSSEFFPKNITVTCVLEWSSMAAVIKQVWIAPHWWLLGVSLLHVL